MHGLVALMELQASRTGARTGPSGEPILLLEQNRARWDHLLIRRGLAALQRAEGLGGARGPYALQAAIAACHARARMAEETDWTRIAGLYEQLTQLTPSPVIELNRAVAVSMAYGPAAGLALVDTLNSERSLAGYHFLPSVRGDLLAKLGRLEEARAEFERAASLTRNARGLFCRIDGCASVGRVSRFARVLRASGVADSAVRDHLEELKLGELESYVTVVGRYVEPIGCVSGGVDERVHVGAIPIEKHFVDTSVEHRPIAQVVRSFQLQVSRLPRRKVPRVRNQLPVWGAAHTSAGV